MAQVPYSGSPSVAPSFIPTPRVSVNTPGAAFGENVGRALEGLGKVSEQAGNELFSRAVAMQQLQNETAAREADSKYMIEAGKLHATYSSLEGKTAVDSFPQYQKDLDGVRKQIREGLPNDMSKKLYDSQSISTMGRTIFNGAGHAASQQKQWALGTANSRIDAAGNQALSFPKDDISFQRGIGQVETEVRQKADLGGWSEDKINDELGKAKSGLWAKRIEGLSRTDPFTAKKLFDKSLQEGNLRGQDIPGVERVVNAQLFTTGARNISSDIFAGRDTSFGSGPVSMDRAKHAIGEFESGSNYLSAVNSGTKHGLALGKYQVMEDNLPGFLKEAGLPNMDVGRFLHDPAAQEKVFEAVFGRYMKETGSFNEAASKWFTGQTIDKAMARSATDKFGTTVPKYLQATNANLAKTASLEEKTNRGIKLAGDLAPDQPLFQDYVRNRIESDENRTKQIQRDHDYTNQNTVSAALMGGFGDGRIPTTVDELIHSDPKAEAAWKELDATHQRKFLATLAHNAKGDTSWTEEGLRRWQELKGMAQSDPAEFLGRDMTGEKLPVSARRELISLQGRLKDKAESDPRVTKALQTLRPMLTPAGMDRAKDKEKYDQFVGSLQDAISDFQDLHKKPPNAEEVQTIGARLLQEQSTPWMLNPWAKTPVFEVPVPQAEAEKIKTDPTWGKLGITPTDQQIQRVYTRKLYNDLYSKPKEAEK